MRALIVVVLALLVPVMCRAERENVALTFDDLPALTQLTSQAYVNYTNATILRGLKRHRFPAIGFVNEGKFDEQVRGEQIEVIEHWLDAGMELGNHTFSHISPNTLGDEAYVEDIARGERVTRPLLAARHRALRYFRHPYLETGTPEETKRKINAWLAEHGYTIAPVTMENSDWMFSEPYDDAIARHEESRIARIKAAYLAYTAKVIPWYQAAAHALLGRKMSFIMLLHVTRLNADCFEDLATMLKRNNLHPVTLEKALRDPAYRMPDPYTGPDGIEWLERWALALHKDLPWDDFHEPPKEIDAEYKRVDSERH
jgi:peptidoglycan/xylan/chitin deacetylase (PgdA/CDA1 family)